MNHQEAESRYESLLNDFWQIRRNKQITAYEADLYYCLVHECKKNKWVNPFPYRTDLICVDIGISRKTLTDVRNRLKQKGLIDFTEGEKNKNSATYTVKYVSEGNIQGNVLGNIQGNIQGNLLNTVYNKEVYIYIQPEISEIEQYAELIGCKDGMAQEYFDHFSATNWIDANGNPIKDWKARLRKWKTDSYKHKSTTNNATNSRNSSSGRTVPGDEIAADDARIRAKYGLQQPPNGMALAAQKQLSGVARHTGR